MGETLINWLIGIGVAAAIGWLMWWIEVGSARRHWRQAQKEVDWMLNRRPPRYPKPPPERKRNPP